MFLKTLTWLVFATYRLQVAGGWWNSEAKLFLDQQNGKADTIEYNRLLGGQSIDKKDKENFY